MKIRTCILVSLMLISFGSTIISGLSDGSEGEIEQERFDDIEEHNMVNVSNRQGSNYFIRNEGQFPDDEHHFYSAQGDVHFLPDGVLMRFGEINPTYDESDKWKDSKYDGLPCSFHEKGVVLKYEFLNANDVVPFGKDICSWNTNYFKGSDPDGWYTDVPNYEEVVYPEVWDGIDVVYKLVDGNVKYDIIVSPGADPDQVRFKVEGGNDLRVDENGDLVIGTDFHDVMDAGLVAFQEGSEEKVRIDFDIIGDDIFGFEVDNYDHSRELVIDPLTYSTLLGTSTYDFGDTVVTDKDGNAYVTGGTSDVLSRFPTTTGAYDTTSNGNYDVYLTKFNSTGGSLVYSTLIGCSKNDDARDLFVDEEGNAYLTGTCYTVNSTVFPTTSGAYDTSPNGGREAYALKLSPDGSSLLYSTYLGGSSDDHGSAIFVDSDGDAFVAGFTYGGSDPFPTTSGAYDTTHNGQTDVFVTKLNSTGASVIYSTFIGASNYDSPNEIDVDAEGCVYLTGRCGSGYPTTSGAYDTSHNGESDVFVTKLDKTGSSLKYSTYIGGANSESGSDIVIDSDNNACIVGNCESGYPTTSGAYDTTHNGEKDVLVTKVNSAGSSLVFSTYIGGIYSDRGYGIDMDSEENIYITGETGDSMVDFPTTPLAYDRTPNGYREVFAAKIDPSGSTLLYSTFLGGNRYDYGEDIDLGPQGYCYITGYTNDGSVDYPTTSGAFSTSNSGNYDVFLTKLFMICDIELPEFDNDQSPSTTTTGDPYSFSVEVTDDIEVDNVSVEYWFGSGDHTNTSMKGSGTYIHNISIPWNSTDTLHYIFHANDTTGNANETEMKNVTVIDNDSPIFEYDGSDVRGTTGDRFIFSLQVRDNIDISEVYLEYWFGSQRHVNTTLPGEGVYNNTITIPDGSTDTLYYKVSAVDLSGNWNVTMIENVTIIDNDRPTFGDDETDVYGTTGDLFEPSIWVSDNIEVRGVFIEYWYGTGSRMNISMSGNGQYTTSIELPSDSTEELHYIFRVNDSSGNWNHTSMKTVSITDDDRPTFFEDSSDSIGYTGDRFDFEIAVTDNINVEDVFVEYWFGSGSHTNSSMEGSGSYGLSTVIPTGSTETLYYIFHSVDLSGNWNSTVLSYVMIEDDDLPFVVVDSTPEAATTGDQLEFGLSVSDNIGISYVLVEYWSGAGNHLNLSMEGDDPYTLQIKAPSETLEDINYIFHYRDLSGNWNHTEMESVQVTDNDAPLFIDDLTPEHTGTGSELRISLKIFDNIDIDTVYLEFDFEGEGKSEVAMEENENLYEFILSVPGDSILPFNYMVTATDISGNINSTERRSVDVVDDILPSIQPVDDVSVYEGDELKVTVDASDNIGIGEYLWSGNPVPASGDTMLGSATDPGTYGVNATVIDEGGNEASIRFTVTVLSEDHDRDEDGIPDLVERALGLDMNSSSDGQLDPDGDGLNNLQEYLNGTGMDEDDTDSDGMPDGWEVENGLDPLERSDENDADNDGLRDPEEFRSGTDPTKEDSDGDGMPDKWELDNDLDPMTPSAENDADGDGISDMDEFRNGSDPNLKDETDNGSTPWLLIIIPLVIVILIGGGIGIFSIMKKGRSEGQEPMESSDDNGPMETRENDPDSEARSIQK